MTLSRKRSQAGFTITEVVIATLIIAILSSIAYSNYTEQVRKVRRGDAQAALLSLANALERYKTNNVGTATTGYNGAAVPAIHPDKAPLDGTRKFYDLSIVAADLSATTYTITASPIASGPMHGDECGTFELDHNGERSLSGASKTLEYCWR